MKDDELKKYLKEKGIKGFFLIGFIRLTNQIFRIFKKKGK